MIPRKMSKTVPLEHLIVNMSRNALTPTTMCMILKIVPFTSDVRKENGNVTCVQVDSTSAKVNKEGRKHNQRAFCRFCIKKLLNNCHCSILELGMCDAKENVQDCTIGAFSSEYEQKCSDKNDGYTLFDTEDCSRFYQCTRGEWQHNSCPEGQYFSTGK